MCELLKVREMWNSEYVILYNSSKTIPTFVKDTGNFLLNGKGKQGHLHKCTFTFSFDNAWPPFSYTCKIL